MIADLDKLHEHCGVFGVFGHPEAANLTYLGLHALQHRGQEAGGIVASDRQRLHGERVLGLVSEGFDAATLARLPGDRAIGHVRYSTAGGGGAANVQPFLMSVRGEQLAICHNGNITNAAALREELESAGAIFNTTSDTEVIVHLLAHQREGSLAERLTRALARVEGAYSLALLTKDELVAVRDPHGFRPLVLGKLKGTTVVASETCALDLIEAELLREIEPGEILTVGARGLSSIRLPPAARLGRCIFELIYFSRPDSTVFSRSVYETRKALGRALFKEQPAKADVVVPVPDSGVPAALGYSEASGIPFDLGLIRSHYVGRTFIEPRDSIRNFGVKLKLNPVQRVVAGKRVVVVDDSLVRGTTSRKIVKLLRDAGAREVHLRISAPPSVNPCYFGIDTPTRAELIASSHTVDEIARFVTADSLGYLSVEAMHGAVQSGGAGFCDACFTGDYLVPPAAELVGLGKR